MKLLAWSYGPWRHKDFLQLFIESEGMLTVSKLLKNAMFLSGRSLLGSRLRAEFPACNPLCSVQIVLLLSPHYCWFNEDAGMVTFLKDIYNVKNKGRAV